MYSVLLVRCWVCCYEGRAASSMATSSTWLTPWWGLWTLNTRVHVYPTPLPLETCWLVRIYTLHRYFSHKLLKDVVISACDVHLTLTCKQICRKETLLLSLCLAESQNQWNCEWPRKGRSNKTYRNKETSMQIAGDDGCRNKSMHILYC